MQAFQYVKWKKIPARCKKISFCSKFPGGGAAVHFSAQLPPPEFVSEGS
jgi:hypothetical protein